MLRGPELLLLDEPLTGLDAELKDRIVVYLERMLAEWRIPTLLVSHDQFDVRRLAEQVVILKRGKRARLPARRKRRWIRRFSAAGCRSTRQSTSFAWRKRECRSPCRRQDRRSQTFHLPARCRRTSTNVVRVRFLPSDVTFEQKSRAGISIRNQLRGTVAEIVARGDLVFVRADVGETFWAEITADALERTGPRRR